METQVYMASEIQKALGLGKTKTYQFLNEVYKQKKTLFRVIKEVSADMHAGTEPSGMPETVQISLEIVRFSLHRFHTPLPHSESSGRNCCRIPASSYRPMPGSGHRSLPRHGLPVRIISSLLRRSFRQL